MKKTVSLLPAVFLLLTSLAACGESEENAGTEENAGSAQSAGSPSAETEVDKIREFDIGN